MYSPSVFIEKRWIKYECLCKFMATKEEKHTMLGKQRRWQRATRRKRRRRLRRRVMVVLAAWSPWQPPLLLPSLPRLLPSGQCRYSQQHPRLFDLCITLCCPVWNAAGLVQSDSCDGCWMYVKIRGIRPVYVSSFMLGNDEIFLPCQSKMLGSVWLAWWLQERCQLAWYLLFVFVFMIGNGWLFLPVLLCYKCLVKFGPQDGCS